MKPENVNQVHKALNKFDNNLCFTVDMFQNEVTPFLDLGSTAASAVNISVETFKGTEFYYYNLLTML